MTERVTVYMPRGVRAQLERFVLDQDGGTLSGYVLHLIRSALDEERKRTAAYDGASTLRARLPLIPGPRSSSRG